MKSRSIRLGDLCTFVRGTSPTLKTLPGPYPLVVTAEYRRSADTWQVEGPAVCIPLISSTGHGDAALHRVHYQDGQFALANLLVALLPKDPNTCSAKFLYYLLMTRKDEILVPLMLGTANVSLKERDIATVEITLPSIGEQQRIVAKIDELIGQIEFVGAVRKKQEQEIRQMLLGAFERVVNGAPRIPMRDVAPLVRRPVKLDPDTLYSELGIRSFGKGTFHKPPLSGIEIGGKRVFHIEPDDLLFSNVFAWEGGIAVAKPEDAGRVGSHRFITCTPKPGIATSQFLCFYFLTQEGLTLIQAASPGGALRNRTLGLTALDNINVPNPPIEDQMWFDTLQAEVAALRREHSKSADDIDSLLPAILDHAFKGELV